MNSCNFVNILIKVSYFIKVLEFNNYNKANLKFYQYLIRKLIYLLSGIRSKIAFAVSQLSKYNADPKISYIKLAKKIVWYLKSIIHLELVYRSQLKDERETKAPIPSSLFEFIGYGDSSYIRDPKDKKLLIRYCYLINGAIVS